MINNTIEEEKLKYIVLIYNPLNVNIISNKEIQFTIPVSLFLDILLMTIHGKTIRFSSKLKKHQNTKETELIREIGTLEKDPNLSQKLISLMIKKTKFKKSGNTNLEVT